MRPHPLYSVIFPDENLCLEKLAYKFVADHADDDNEPLNEAKTLCARALIHWRDSFRPDTLVYEVTPSWVSVLDRRGPSPIISDACGTPSRKYSCRATNNAGGDHVVHQFNWLDPTGSPRFSTGFMRLDGCIGIDRVDALPHPFAGS